MSAYSDAEDAAVGAITAAARTALDSLVPAVIAEAQAEQAAQLQAALATAVKLQSDMDALQARYVAVQDALAAETAAFDAYKQSHPDPTPPPPPPPPPAVTLLGASANGADDPGRLQSWGTSPKAFRVFYTGKAPTSWTGVLAAIPAGSTVVVSYHQVMTEAELSALVKSVPRPSLLRRGLSRLRLAKAVAPITLILSYDHEPEDNFTTAAAQAQFRSDASAQGKIIRGLGVEFWLIIMGYSLTDAGHRAGRDAENFYVPEHSGVGVDFYDKLDMTNIMPLTVAFAGKHGIRWAITECGIGKVAGDTAESKRIAYAKALLATMKAQPVPPVLATWYDYQKSPTTTDYRLTQPVAQTFLGVAA